MLPYWFFFIVSAIAALASKPRMHFSPDGTRPIQINSAWLLTIVILTAVIGFRYKVGGDWENYFRYLSTASYLNFTDLVTMEDPGYWALNILSFRLGWGMTGVNTFSALIFSTGLVVFCRSLSRPWIALACSIPYLVLVVAMGYTRQAIALGLVMVGLIMLSRGRFMAFAIWVLVGALFHKSAVVLIPIASLTITKNRLFTLTMIFGATLLGYRVLLEDSANDLIQTYKDQNFESSGALIRLAMNFVPAVIFLRYRRVIALPEGEKKLWFLMSTIAVVMLVAFFLTNLSTALDRLALYIIPLQLIVFANLPDIWGNYGRRNQAIVVYILIYYAAVMFIWLNYATHSNYWIPYKLGIA